MRFITVRKNNYIYRITIYYNNKEMKNIYRLKEHSNKKILVQYYNTYRKILIVIRNHTEKKKTIYSNQLGIPIQNSKYIKNCTEIFLENERLIFCGFEVFEFGSIVVER